MTPTASFTVAIVDDDPAIRRLIHLLLTRSGYDVLEAASAAEARALFHEQPWDLAILDRRLPDLDGIILCHELKSNPEFRPRYVIVLTGEDEEHEKILGLDLGADDYITKPFHQAELLARIRAGKRIVDLQKELVASNKRLELLSITDGLTNLYNHRYFQEELAREFDASIRYQRPLSLAVIDIDFFKKINDQFGHASGDRVLKEVAEIFKRSVRSSDLVARYGGEEFAVMMPETLLDDGMQFAEKIRSLVESQPIATGTESIPVNVSIGVSALPHTKVVTPKDLIVAADKALYRAKRGGRNRVESEQRKQRRGDDTASRRRHGPVEEKEPERVSGG